MSFRAYQSGSGQETASLFADPLIADPWHHDIGRPTAAFALQEGSRAIDAGANVGDMGAHDFFGNPIPFGAGYDIGAHEWYGGGSSQGSSKVSQTSFAPDVDLDAIQGGVYNPAQFKGRAVLLSFLDTDSRPYWGFEGRDLSRSQSVFLHSMMEQYGARGLTVLAVDTGGLLSGEPSERQDLVNLVQSWRLEDIPLMEDPLGAAAQQLDVSQTPTTVLIGADGRLKARWDGFAPAPALAFAVMRELSTGPFFAGSLEGAR
jgi:peroxiredoxin